jgi:Predicted Fe-S oxidoreductases
MKEKLNIGWGLTNRCNMACKFCYSKDTREILNECNINDWKKFVNQNHEKIDSINYGTGENCIMDDFFYLIDYVRSNYPTIQQSLTTNGYIYERVSNNSEFMAIYKRAIDEVDVSLDFSDKDRHNNFRGQPKAYEWAINTLKMLKKDNKKATIVFVGFEETMQKECIDSLFAIGKEYNALLRLNIYRPVSAKPEINQKFILSSETLMQALSYINDKYEIVSLSDILFGTILTDQESLVENTGVGSIRILPDGSICPSTYLITEEYRNKFNIKNDNVLEDLFFSEFENAPTPEECKECVYCNKCKGGVYDRRFLWYETLNQRDPYCPIRLGKKLPIEKFHVTRKDRISVHDEYLPTMFFRA